MKKNVLETIVRFWNDHIEMAGDANVDKEDILRLNEFEKGNLELPKLTYEQRTRIQRAYVMGENLCCNNENMFKINIKRYENADYCSFCNCASLDYMDRITDKKGTIVFCPNCGRRLGLSDLWFFEGDDDLECMLTNKPGAVSYKTALLSKPINVSPDIINRLFKHKLSESEQQKIYEINGDDEQTELFFHLI